jgi:hypothetical protein
MVRTNFVTADRTMAAREIKELISNSVVMAAELVEEALGDIESLRGHLPRAPRTGRGNRPDLRHYGELLSPSSGIPT